MQQEDMLRQAWDAPGSPFAGQPFNPSAVNWGSAGGAGGVGGGSGPSLSTTAAGATMNSPKSVPDAGSRSISGPDYDSMIAAAQGPEERAKLQAMQAKRLSRVESMNSGPPDSEKNS